MPARNLLYYLSNQHNLIVKLLIFSLSVGLIVYVLPKEGRFRYEFSMGKTWLHNDLKAPFDFAIQKSKSELDAEADAVVKNSRKYYRYDYQVGAEKVEQLAMELDSFLLRLNRLGGDESSLRNRLREQILREVPALLNMYYDQGILQKMVGSTPGQAILIERRNDVLTEKEYRDYLSKEDVLKSLSIALFGTQQWKDEELRLFFDRYITPNVFFDDQSTQIAARQAITDISNSRGMVSKGERIISKGDVITADKYQILISLREEYDSRMGIVKISRFWLITGQTVMVCLLLGMLLVFLVLLRKDLFEDSIKLTLLFSLVTATVILAALFSRSPLFSIYVLPFCVLPIIIRAFFDTRLALFAHLLTMMIVGFLVANPFEFLLVQVLGGMACIFSIVNLRKRSRLFVTITLLAFVYWGTYSAITLMVEGSLAAIQIRQLMWLGGSASLTLFSYPMIYLFEKVFGFTSDVSLLELSDTNNPLLKELAFKAPGTFQHSLQVANLAEAAIYRIGGNSLLVRTGALYHDIGKMELARYFIENQVTSVNPHDELAFDESARLIISHVKLGVQLGRKHKLPDKVLDFIRTHHGTTRVQYFYRSYLKSFPQAEVDEAAFRYPGPIPFSRETAVVMMADAVEATSRSLKEVNSEKINQMVEEVINRQIDDGQFMNADITFRDITAIKKIFKKMLMNIYHVRMEYPK